MVFSEAVALRQGIIEASRCDIPRLMIEGDNLHVENVVFGD